MRGNPWSSRKSSSFLVNATLWAADRSRRWIELAGIDFAVFRVVLEQRVRMGTEAKFGGQPGAMTVGLGMILVGFALVMAGLGSGVAALVTRQPTLWMWIGQGAWIFMLTSLCVNYFANVLLDPSDIGVLASRPVGDRTIVGSRFAEVLLPTALLALCAASAPTVFGAFTLHPLGALVAFPLATLSSGLVVLAGMTLVVALALRVVGPVRFQRVMFWLQLAAAISIGAGPQLANRVIPMGTLTEAYSTHPWLAWVNPIEHHLALYALLGGDFESRTLTLAALVFVLPVALGGLAFALLRQDFIAALADRGELVRSARRGFRPSLFARVGSVVCRSKAARAVFGFTLALTRRERPYLRTVVPMAATTLVMAVVLTRPRASGTAAPMLVAGCLYYLAILPTFVYGVARVSEHAEARWWFDALPFSEPSAALEGGAKAILCGTLLPIAAFACVAASSCFESLAWRDGLLVFVALAALDCVSARFFMRKIPFSTAPSLQIHYRDLVTTFAILAVIGLLVFVHWLSTLHFAVWAAALALYAVAFALGWRALARLTPAP
ncbi:MAG: hypothetical protein IT454_19015 [Planctomycetes bacterium]|nr:hypothetical protein [Planctomycetota bacterium]